MARIQTIEQLVQEIFNSGQLTFDVLQRTTTHLQNTIENIDITSLNARERSYLRKLSCNLWNYTNDETHAALEPSHYNLRASVRSAAADLFYVALDRDPATLEPEPEGFMSVNPVRTQHVQMMNMLTKTSKMWLDMEQADSALLWILKSLEFTSKTWMYPSKSVDVVLPNRIEWMESASKVVLGLGEQACVFFTICATLKKPCLIAQALVQTMHVLQCDDTLIPSLRASMQRLLISDTFSMDEVGESASSISVCTYIPYVLLPRATSIVLRMDNHQDVDGFPEVHDSFPYTAYDGCLYHFIMFAHFLEKNVVTGRVVEDQQRSNLNHAKTTLSRLYVKWAQRCRRAQHISQARWACETALRYSPGCFVTRCALCEVLIIQGSIHAAMEQFESLLQRNLTATHSLDEGMNSATIAGHDTLMSGAVAREADHSGMRDSQKNWRRISAIVHQVRMLPNLEMGTLRNIWELLRLSYQKLGTALAERNLSTENAELLMNLQLDISETFSARGCLDDALELIDGLRLDVQHATSVISTELRERAQYVCWMNSKKYSNPDSPFIEQWLHHALFFGHGTTPHNDACLLRSLAHHYLALGDDGICKARSALQEALMLDPHSLLTHYLRVKLEWNCFSGQEGGSECCEATVRELVASFPTLEPRHLIPEVCLVLLPSLLNASSSKAKAAWSRRMGVLVLETYLRHSVSMDEVCQDAENETITTRSKPSVTSQQCAQDVPYTDENTMRRRMLQKYALLLLEEQYEDPVEEGQECDRTQDHHIRSLSWACEVFLRLAERIPRSFEGNSAANRAVSLEELQWWHSVAHNAAVRYGPSGKLFVIAVRIARHYELVLAADPVHKRSPQQNDTKERFTMSLVGALLSITSFQELTVDEAKLFLDWIHHVLTRRAQSNLFDKKTFPVGAGSEEQTVSNRSRIYSILVLSEVACSVRVGVDTRTLKRLLHHRIGLAMASETTLNPQVDVNTPNCSGAISLAGQTFEGNLGTTMRDRCVLLLDIALLLSEEQVIKEEHRDVLMQCIVSLLGMPRSMALASHTNSAKADSDRFELTIQQRFALRRLLIELLPSRESHYAHLVEAARELSVLFDPSICNPSPAETFKDVKQFALKQSLHCEIRWFVAEAWNSGIYACHSRYLDAAHRLFDLALELASHLPSEDMLLMELRPQYEAAKKFVSE